MLMELKIRNLAIIESVDIFFKKGLNVLTGETGAGKSILLDALNLALGGRSDRALVRTGSQEAWVEAVFESNERSILQAQKWGIELKAGDVLALRRVIQANGRSRAYVNCMTVPANLLRQLAVLLLDFGRQHEQSTLMSSEKHLELLDRYANAQKQRIDLEKKHGETVSLLAQQRQLEKARRDRAERREFLDFQKESISRVNPQPDEEQELERELEKLEKADQCRQLARQVGQELCRGDNAIRDRLASTVSKLEDLAGIDDSVEHVLKDLQNALISVEEAAHSMQVYQKGVYFDAERTKEIETRLDEIIKLQRRHGGTYQGVKKRLEEIDEELKELAEQEHRLEELDGLIAASRAQLGKQATALREKRQKSASLLAPKVAKQLDGLAMKNARFEVRFMPIANDVCCVFCGKEGAVAPWGTENVNFMFSANPGEELQPLERVASGGELSRIMLALKKVMVSAFPVDTFVVDEIDSGVAGAAATRVAEKLRQIISESKGASQIISVSHTPQIAAEADSHFHVQKTTREGRTIAQIEQMEGQRRIVEISRMLAGDRSSEQALALARELIDKSTAGAC